MRKFLLILLISTMLLQLAACSNKEHAEELMTEIRGALTAAPKITAVADIRADYTDRVFDFKVKFSGTEAAGEISIIEPESLAGVLVRVSGNGAPLLYDGAEIDTGELENDLSPVGIIPMLLNEWKNGFAEFTYKEKRGSGRMLAMSSTLSGGAVQKTWFEEKNGLPIRAEVSASGRTVITIEFENIIYE